MPGRYKIQIASDIAYYSAPCDGYLLVNALATDNNATIIVYSQFSGIYTTLYIPQKGLRYYTFIPLAKGDNAIFSLNKANIQNIVFIYSKSSQSEV